MTATDERGNVKRRFADAYGRITRVEVNGAETYATTYEHDAVGSLTRVVNHVGSQTTIAYDLLGRKTAITDPNMGSWSYTYDATGNVTSQTDASNQTLTFTYDLQGRMLTKTYPASGGQITWTYDDPVVPYSKGRLTRVVDLATNTTFQYDALGRVTQTSRVLDASTYTMTRSYDALGRVTQQTFPDLESVSYTYNEAGWLSAVPGYITAITYNARGQRIQAQYANGTTSTFTYYDGTGDALSFRPKTRVTTGPGGTLQHFTYAHDNAGNITQITDAAGTTGSRSFQYDALNRLTQAEGTFGVSQANVTETYAYDAVGNITSKAGIAYAYSDPLHPSAVTSRSDGKTYTYDANGNTLNGAGRALSWDYDNRLAAVTIQGGNSAEFAYDYSGQRVRKTVNAGSVTRYPFPGYEIGPGEVITKRFGEIAKKSSGQTLTYHDDHLGGVHVITDAAGVRVQLVEYTPWGEVSRSEGTADADRRFTGQRLDPETGLMYYGGRYYDPMLARFVSADPFVPSPSNPQSFNRYSYVENNLYRPGFDGHRVAGNHAATSSRVLNAVRIAVGD
jgi:RHS repeat-associated protein